MSDKRADAAPTRRTVTQQVFDRDGGCLLAPVVKVHIPPCHGKLTPHHIRKAGQGGTWTIVNIVALCARHNDWLEDLDGMLYGRPAGLICLRTDTLEACWDRLAAAGLVTYNPQGAPL
jgi:hypothetical protein